MKPIRTLVVALLVGVSWGCDSYLDINTNPNVPPYAGSEYVLPATQLMIAVGFGGKLFNIGGFFAQYWTQSPGAQQHRNIDAYLLDKGEIDQSYTNLTSAMSNLKEIKKEAIADKNWALNLVCVTLEVYSWQLLVDLYDNISYRQALDVNDTHADFDDGELIYTSIIARLEDALSKDFDMVTCTLAGFTDSDFIMEGDVDRWIAFGRSLLLKLHVRSSFSGLYNKAKVGALLVKGRFIKEDVTFAPFSNAAYKRNPWFETEVYRLKGINHIASKTLANYLSAYNDPRLKTIYRANSNGNYNANWQGDYEFLHGSVAAQSNFATPNIDFDQPVYFMTVSEVNFFISEIHAKEGNYTLAKDFYEKGIRASLHTHAITGADSIATTTYAWDSWEGETPANFERALKKIALQKWIALAKVNHIEAFFELNRTGYPSPSALNPEDDRRAPFIGGELILSVTGRSGVLNGQFPKRFFYPNVEVTRNEHAPTQPSSIAKKIWWDQK